MASIDSPQLKWSTRLRVSPPFRTPRLVGDKIVLPQSALEALLAAAPVISLDHQSQYSHSSSFDPFNPYSYAAEQQARAYLADRQQQLPHPLTFRLVNSDNGRMVYAGIREFSAAEEEVGLSRFLRNALGFEVGSSPSSTRDATPLIRSRAESPMQDVAMSDAPKEHSISAAEYQLPSITIHAEQVPKGTYVRLRPLEAGYDPEDWKSLLERYLRDNFTTLTKGEILEVPATRHDHFKFLIDKIEPDENAICIVDTDLEVDIEPLNEEQARQTLKQRLAKNERAPGTAQGSSSGGNVSVEADVEGRILPGEYVDYVVKEWRQDEELAIILEGSKNQTPLDLFVSPFSTSQRSKAREDEHVFSNFDTRPSKRIKISPTNVAMEQAESLFISIHADKSISASEEAIVYSLRINRGDDSRDGDQTSEHSLPSADEVVCKNCKQIIPKRTLPLHEAFCYRNNISCPKCSHVFLKNSEAWKTHWHCPYDSAFGSGVATQSRHDNVFHPASTLACPSCDFQAYNLPILAQHRTTDCPGKEILCRFCHLVVPQKSDEDPAFNDPEVLLSGLTPHEVADGARTTECHLCARIVRLRDMDTHLRLHDRERLSKPKPRICANRICGRVVGDKESKEQLGLCGDCFGPLYVTSYDPEGKMLRRRIERRLLTQLTGGCGKSWCKNTQWCRTALKNESGQERSITTKDALPIVKPLTDALAKGQDVELCFCVDETSQRRKTLAAMMAGEGVHEVEWCVKALQEEHGDLGKAREWLGARAPKIGEVVR